MIRRPLIIIWMLCTLWCQAALATPDPVVIMRTQQAGGSYRFPLAPVWSAWWTKSPVDYEMSELTTGTTGDSNIALCSATYKWTLNTGTIYCVELAAGGNPSLSAPTTIPIDGYSYFAGNVTVDTVKPGQCAYGTPAVGFAFNTVCCNTWDRVDPDIYSDDGAITAVYGQGARWGFSKRTDLAYDNGTGALTGTSAFLLYGFHSGDRILIAHADINAGTPTWTQITSKTNKDGIVVASGLSNGNETNVTAYVHQIPGMDFDFRWAFTNNHYTFTNTDDRPQASSTVIPGGTFVGPIASHVFYPHSDPATLLSENVTLLVYDRVNGLESSPYSVSYNDLGWVADRHIYLDVTSGTDVANCLTGLQSGCTSGAPCQTVACGISQLRRTAGAAVLHLKKGDTYTLTADVASFSGDADDKWITTHGSGATPIITATGYRLIQGTVSNLRLGEFTITAGSGVKSFDGPVCNNCAIWKLAVTGGGQAVMDIDGVNVALIDNQLTTTATGQQYALFAMGGDAVSAYTARQRAYIGNKLITNESNDVIMRVRGQECVVAYHHNEIIADSDNSAFNALKFANDNCPHLGMFVYASYLYRAAGTGTTGPINTIAQSGGLTDYIRIESVFGGTYDGSVVRNFYENNNGTSAHVDHVALRNNVMWQVVRGVDLRLGKELISQNNSAYLPRANTVEFYRITGGAGYTDLWSLNDSVSAPNAGGSSRYIQNEGANTTVELNHLHKSNLNYANFGTAIRINATNYSVSGYETARSGLDILGGSSGAAVDPKYAAVASKDLRPCTATDVPVSGCTVSPLVDAGFTLPDVPVGYAAVSRPQNSVYDIGAFETGSVTGKCCHCDGACEDSVSESYCTSIGGAFTASASCSGNCATGACCTPTQGACTVMTDACCLETYAGDGTTCADCLGKCCSRTGGCTVTKQANCNSSNAQWTWGGTCGTCATEACCTGASCADLTSYACTAEGGSPQGVGSDCSPNPCAVPTGSCCKVDGSCMVTDQTTCTAIAEAIWSSGGVCSPNTCAPAGACCKAGETCENETSAGCVTDSGTWLGAGTVCVPDLCAIRACCTAGPTCTLTVQANCSGTFLWPNIVCTGTPCNQRACCDGVGGCTDEFATLCIGTWHATSVCADDPCNVVGACCFANDSCFVGSAGDCTLASGTYRGNDTTCEADCVGACWSHRCHLCTETTFINCTYWEGAQTTCAGTSPCKVGCCTLPNGINVRYNETSCLYFSGTYAGDDTQCDEPRRGLLHEIFKPMRGPFRGLGYGYDEATGEPWDKP